MKEELPGRAETERNLTIADRPYVPRLTKKEKTLLMNCERPLNMEEWREMTRERQRGTLENVKMAYYAEEATPEVSGEKGANTTVSSKPPPPKAPITYWQYLRVESAAETGKGKDSEGIDSEGEDRKGKDVMGKAPKVKIKEESIPKERTPKERIPKGRIPKEERHCRR